LNWNDLEKKTTLKAKSKQYQLRTTPSLFSRLMIIAKSERDIDENAAISEFEFLNVNYTLMNPDESLITCKTKSDLANEPITLAPHAQSSSLQGADVLIIDGMAAVQALMHAVHFKTCFD